jgi:hypothetical protein
VPEKEKKSFYLFYGNCTLLAEAAGLTFLSAEQCNTHGKIIVSVYE